MDRSDFFLHLPPLWSLKPHTCLILAFACPKIEKKNKHLFCRLIPVKSSWCSLTSDYVCTSQTQQLRNETLNKLSSKVASPAGYYTMNFNVRSQQILSHVFIILIYILFNSRQNLLEQHAQQFIPDSLEVFK